MTRFIIMSDDGLGWRYCKSDDDFGCTTDITEALVYTIRAGAEAFAEQFAELYEVKTKVVEVLEQGDTFVRVVTTGEW